MTPYEAAEVLALFEEAEGFDNGLSWRVDMSPGAGREMRLYAECSDLFSWATADFEEITVADVPPLRQALEDLKALRSHDEGQLGHLFAARKRRMRPQRPCYRDFTAGLAALYDACCTEEERAEADRRDAAWWIAVARKIREERR